MRRIDRVRVHRVKDASGRRLPLQAKVGATLEPDEFRERVRAGRLGHVGLLESAHALAAAFGWRLTRVEQAIDPVIAATVVSSGLGDIAPGRVLGLHQTLNAWSDEEQVIGSNSTWWSAFPISATTSSWPAIHHWRPSCREVYTATPPRRRWWSTPSRGHWTGRAG